MARAPLGPAVPIGFGGVMDWLLENGYIEHQDQMVEMLREGKGSGTRAGQVRKTARRAFRLPSRAKKPRKVSKYQRAFGACLKDLKKQHPRTPTTRLMKRAHACARKKKKQGGW